MVRAIKKKDPYFVSLSCTLARDRSGFFVDHVWPRHSWQWRDLDSGGTLSGRSSDGIYCRPWQRPSHHWLHSRARDLQARPLYSFVDGSSFYGFLVSIDSAVSPQPDTQDWQRDVLGAHAWTSKNVPLDTGDRAP